MTITQEKSLVEQYVEFSTNRIDEDGIQPNMGWAKRHADGKLVVFAIVASPEDWARLFWKEVGSKSPSEVNDELVFGLDMVTKEGQGTEFADALVFVHWKRDPDKKLADSSCFRVGVVNYQHEPRVVRPVDWENEHWTQWTLGWLKQHHPGLLFGFRLKDDPPPKKGAE